MADGFWSLVVVAVVAGLILTTLGWMWQRRNWVLRLPQKGRAAYWARLERKKVVMHTDLVEDVRRRAETLGVEIVDRVEGGNPAVITHYPTGRQFAVFRDFPSYRAAAQSGRTDPRHSHYGEAPRPVSEWSDAELRAWLKRHQHETPEG